MTIARRQTAVLMYHELATAGHATVSTDAGYLRYVIDSSDFASHLGMLAAVAGPSRSLRDALRDEPGHHPVVTFDDGCETDLTLAAGHLLDASCGATFFVSTANMGQRGYLSHAQVRELYALGFEVGSHGHTHRYLPDLPSAELEIELRESRVRLEQVLGAPVRSMSCPGGRWSAAVARRAQEAGYDIVATSERRPFGAGADPFRVPRFAITTDVRSSAVRRLAAGQGDTVSAAFRARIRGTARGLLGPHAYDRLRAIWLGDLRRGPGSNRG